MTASARARAERSRPARIVSVCIAGRPVTQERFNTNRLELISKVAREIRRREWPALDALVFPAGFLRLATWFGPLDADARWLALYDSEIADVCRGAVHCLRLQAPRCLVVVGIDTNRSPEGWRGDQLTVALDSSGPVGVARKVFTSDGDTNGETRAPYLLFADDYASPERYVQLPNGQSALLSACYDAFALSELALGPTAKRAALRYLASSTGWDILDRGGRDDLLAAFRQQLRRHAPTVNLVAIHGFQRAGADVYWQRHGIATASAAMHGGLTVGAAHFAQGLPERPSSAPLAAVNVPRSHLHANPHRRAHALVPTDGLETSVAVRPSQRALVRLYEDT